MRGIATRVEELLGQAVVATTPVAGGDICTSTRVRLSSGSSVLVKTRANAPAGLLRDRGRGPALARRTRRGRCARGAGGRGGLPGDRLDRARPADPRECRRPGRSLARLHASGADELGAAHDGYIGSLPLPNKTASSWPEFYAVRRILPYLKLASDRGHVGRADVLAVEGLVGRITDLAGPAEPPARIHGDLWSGNVVWSPSGAHLIDPAAHGGHRETDLAMLALFGLPHLQRLVDAYQEEAPLAEGWEQRPAVAPAVPAARPRRAVRRSLRRSGPARSPRDCDRRGALRLVPRRLSAGFRGGWHASAVMLS